MELQAESADTSEKDFVNTVSLLTSHPSWMVRRWASRLGRKGAFALARANNEIPSLTLRVNTLMTNREEVLRKMEAEGWKAEATQYSPFGIRLDGTVPFSRLAPFWGLVSVQDEAAQLMSMMLGPKPGERILDACAAPGGKATHLAQIMGDSGEVLAVEVELKRLARLKENIAALGLKSIKVVHDNLLGFQSGQGFDRVMLDAPCSASGVIRRNPDVRYRFREKDLREFGSRQLELLRAGSALLRPGGELLYCTCSTEPEEGEDVVRKFLRTSSEFFIIEDIPSVSELLSSGMLRTYPHIHGTDGFFGVKLGWKR
ncbi:MAG: RsmB/NOP family class I SAM-dependent RNA methyltransferase [Desulfobacterales bacterium]|nr:RsmB/NOP family class I SAM-dependent RNA methyltransferase [Desulfobacterales bacterium]